MTAYLARYPTAFANWLPAASLAIGGIVELAIVGDPTDPATRALLAVATGAAAGSRRGRLGGPGGSASRCSPIGR